MTIPSIHAKFATAFAGRAGKRLTRSEIEKIVLARFPDTPDGSILPDDHGAGNVKACRCSGTSAQIFETVVDKTGDKVYDVRDFSPLGAAISKSRDTARLNIHRWWEDRQAEKYWLEVTRRPDIGENLKAPQANELGQPFWSYALLAEAKNGDCVFDYDGNRQTINSFSFATGEVWEDTIVWAARGSSARSADIKPHIRLGWYLGLERYEKLKREVLLARIRSKATDLAALI